MERAPGEPVIATWGLRKEFGSTVAVADLTLQVEAGEVFGFLGPNGAGKTTSLKMLLGLVHPSAGEGALLGQPLGTPAVRSRVGFLPEHFRFPHWLTAREFLDIHGRMLDLPSTERHGQTADLLDLVEPDIGRRPPPGHLLQGDGSSALVWPRRCSATRCSSSSMSQPPVSTRSGGGSCGRSSATCAIAE